MAGRSIPTRYLRQNITRWTVSEDGYGGFEFGPPQVIKGRWEQHQKLFTDLEGHQKVSRAEVFLAESVEVGDYLYNGYTTELDPTTICSGECFRVQMYHEIPDLRNIMTVRQAIL